MRSDAAMLVSHAANQRRNSGYLDHVVHVEIAVKDRMRQWQILDFVFRQDLLDFAARVLPLGLTMKVVQHEKTAAQEPLAHRRGVFRSQFHVAWLDDVG